MGSMKVFRWNPGVLVIPCHPWTCDPFSTRPERNHRLGINCRVCVCTVVPDKGTLTTSGRQNTKEAEIRSSDFFLQQYLQALKPRDTHNMKFTIAAFIGLIALMAPSAVLVLLPLSFFSFFSLLLHHYHVNC